MDLNKIILEGVNFLKKNYDLPSNGFLAGGALGNIVNELVFGDKAIINDIDIFSIKIVNRKYNDLRLIRAENRDSIIYTQEFESIDNEYKNIEYENNEDYLIFSNSSYNGIINYVEYESNILDYDFFLSCFDLNCCQVGFDLDNNQIYYTEGFKKYLDTKELKVMDIKSPSNTVVRLFKKRDELCAKLNVDEELTLLSYSTRCIKNTIINGRMNEKFIFLYEKYFREISPYFKLDKLFLLKSTQNLGYCFSKTDNYDNRFYKFISNYYSLHNIKFDFNGELLNNITLSKLLFYYRNIRTDKTLDIYYRMFYNSYRDTSFFDGYDYSLSFDELKVMSDELNKHNGLKIGLHKANLKEIIEFFKNIKKLNIENQLKNALFTLNTANMVVGDLRLFITFFKIKNRLKIYEFGKANMKLSELC